MERGTFLLLVSTCFLCRAQGPSECQERPVSVGGTLQLQPEKPPERWIKLTWRVRSDGGDQHWILRAEKNKSVQYSRVPVSGRAGFQEETVSLCISLVRPADSGVYWAEFEDTSGSVTHQCFWVSVWDPVGQPRLEAHILHQEQSWCNLSLHCTMPNTGNVSYNWSCTGDPPAALGHQPRLQLQVRGDTDPTVCCCNVSNLVSWSMASTDVVAACHSAASGLSLCCGTKLLKGLVGQSLSFPALHLMSADVARVTWRSRGTHIAEAKPREKIFTVDYLPDFRGRLLIHPTNLSLEIRRLNLADSGRYKVVVDTLSDPTNPKTFHYFLLVHDGSSEMATGTDDAGGRSGSTAGPWGVTESRAGDAATPGAGYGTLRRPYVLLPL
ncbi:natural killer cell receptor 2B4-like isoform X2 [Grus americana]|uniref:natural killer cell receptor 2B4-like isoform X2 n=1 Tax=Grus americana TaxID=9117 RepID=UPI002407B748|nr:natural killer cell receptor 2B4-like isoform X2 [Grus americana]